MGPLACPTAAGRYLASNGLYSGVRNPEGVLWALQEVKTPHPIQPNEANYCSWKQVKSLMLSPSLFQKLKSCCELFLMTQSSQVFRILLYLWKTNLPPALQHCPQRCRAALSSQPGWPPLCWRDGNAWTSQRFLGVLPGRYRSDTTG